MLLLPARRSSTRLWRVTCDLGGVGGSGAACPGIVDQAGAVAKTF